MTHTVVYYVASDTFGGAEHSLLTTLAGLDRERWRPVLFHPAHPGLSPLLDGARRLGIQTHEAARVWGRGTAGKLASFRSRLLAERPAVFHAHLYWPAACKLEFLAAALARVPAVVATEHSLILPPPRRAIVLQRLLSPLVDRYIAVSRDLARRLSRTLGFPESKLTVVPNGVSLESFQGSRDPVLRRELDLGTDRPVVLTVARLDAAKGIAHLLEAASRVPEALFVVAGDGPLRGDLERQAREAGLGDRVRFLGQRWDVPALLHAADLFVLPSLSEGLPLTVLEAMAAGAPVVATAAGGTAEAVVHGETGLLVPPADPAALAGAVRTLLADRERALEMAAAARARVRERFSAETMVKGITGIYEDLLSARGHH